MTLNTGSQKDQMFTVERATAALEIPKKFPPNTCLQKFSTNNFPQKYFHIQWWKPFKKSGAERLRLIKGSPD